MVELTFAPAGTQQAGVTVNSVALSILLIIVPDGTYAPALIVETTIP